MRGLLSAALATAVLLALASPAAAAPKPECWVSWRPSEGSTSFAGKGRAQTVMTVRLKWRQEDLTFRRCRSRTSFELETTFGTSSGRHKLSHLGMSIEQTDLPTAYVDGFQEPAEATIGISHADKLVADRWYTVKLSFLGRLGPNEFIDQVASRGYRLSPCPFVPQLCVNGWFSQDKYGPSERIPMFRRLSIADGRTSRWSFPTRSTLRNKIVRHPRDRDAHLVDGSGVRHWIPDGGTYLCLVARGRKVVNSFAGLDQRWVINSFPQGSNATCTPPARPGPAAPPAPAPAPRPAPAPAPATRQEQQGSLGANTFRNPYNASGMGQKIAPYQWVAVSCKVYAPQIVSANPDGYWYRIASAPWSNQYYAVANTFWNGDVPGKKPYTHNTDWAVPNC